MNQKSKVAVVPCHGYEPSEVKKALAKAIELIGGFEPLIKREENILLKPNLLAAVERSTATDTDPEVMRALIQLLKEDGYTKISAGDSGSKGVKTEKSAKKCGLFEVLETEGVELCDFETPVPTKMEDGNTLMIAKEVLDCDALISISKMKTHALERITGAIKNQYGCVSGRNKGVGHTLYPNSESFAHVLVELNLLVAPRLYIMDGIIGMDGNGPGSGDPIAMNVLLASTDPVALDTAFCHLVYLKPELVPTNVAGERQGLGNWREEKLEIVTMDGSISIEEMQKRYGNPNFNVDRKEVKSKGLLDYVGFLNPLQKRPVIDPSICKKCGVCVENCPVEGKAVTFKKGKDHIPVYNYRKCIRCYCCQEMCPFHAIKVK